MNSPHTWMSSLKVDRDSRSPTSALLVDFLAGGVLGAVIEKVRGFDSGTCKYFKPIYGFGLCLGAVINNTYRSIYGPFERFVLTFGCLCLTEGLGYLLFSPNGELWKYETDLPVSVQGVNFKHMLAAAIVIMALDEFGLLAF